MKWDAVCYVLHKERAVYLLDTGPVSAVHQELCDAATGHGKKGCLQKRAVPCNPWDLFTSGTGSTLGFSMDGANENI